MSEAERRLHVRVLLRELAELGWRAVIWPDSKVTLQAARPKKLGFELRWKFRQHHRDIRRLIREGGLSTSVLEQPIESARRKLRVADRVLDVGVTEIVLDDPCVPALVGELESACVP